MGVGGYPGRGQRRIIPTFLEPIVQVNSDDITARISRPGLSAKRYKLELHSRKEFIFEGERIYREYIEFSNFKQYERLMERLSEQNNGFVDSSRLIENGTRVCKVLEMIGSDYNSLLRKYSSRSFSLLRKL